MQIHGVMPKTVPESKSLIEFIIYPTPIEESIVQVTYNDIVTLNISRLASQKQYIYYLESISKNIILSMNC